MYLGRNISGGLNYTFGSKPNHSIINGRKGVRIGKVASKQPSGVRYILNSRTEPRVTTSQVVVV